jgi:hypothetical protein
MPPITLKSLSMGLKVFASASLSVSNVMRGSLSGSCSPIFRSLKKTAGKEQRSGGSFPVGVVVCPVVEDVDDIPKETATATPIEEQTEGHILAPKPGKNIRAAIGWAFPSEGADPGKFALTPLVFQSTIEFRSAKVICQSELRAREKENMINNDKPSRLLKSRLTRCRESTVVPTSNCSANSADKTIIASGWRRWVGFVVSLGCTSAEGDLAKVSDFSVILRNI